MDNNSTDRTSQVIRDFAASTPLCVRPVFESKTGLSHARNAGIHEAHGRILAFTDDDVTLDSAWLCELKQVFDRFGCLGVAGRIVPVWECLKPGWLITEGPGALMRAVLAFELGPEICQMDTAPFGANMAFHRDAFAKYGQFRTDLGAHGRTSVPGEDTEFSNRLLSHGEAILYTPHAVVYHPVEKERTRKGYFEKWYFHYGRSMVLTQGIPRGAVHYFGVPRYMFRRLLTESCQWMVGLDSAGRFRHKLNVLSQLGEIREARRLSG